MSNHASPGLAHVYANRRAQLRRLIDQRAAGNIAAFAEQLGYSRARVSQFLSETYNDGRSIGERAARAIEEDASLPLFWMEQSEATSEIPVAADGHLALILAELRKHTTLLEVLAKQGDHAALRTAPATGAAASGLPG